MASPCGLTSSCSSSPPPSRPAAWCPSYPCAATRRTQASTRTRVRRPSARSTAIAASRTTAAPARRSVQASRRLRAQASARLPRARSRAWTHCDRGASPEPACSTSIAPQRTRCASRCRPRAGRARSTPSPTRAGAAASMRGSARARRRQRGARHAICPCAAHAPAGTARRHRCAIVGFRWYSIARTSFCVASSMPWVASAPMMSSIAARYSSPLMFMPRWASIMLLPV